jgi:hypothetical protein
MKAYRIVFGLALAAGVSGFSTTSLAQTARPESPVAAAAKLETQAKTAVDNAKKDRDRARAKVVTAFKATEPGKEYATTETELTKAKAAMEQAKVAAQAKTRALPEYKNATTSKAAVQEKLNAMRDDRGPTADKERNALLEQSQSHAMVINRMEQGALTNDVAYADAKIKVAELTKALDGFNIQIDELAKVDPEFMMAEQNVLTAEQAYAQAKQATADARKQMADAARQNAASKSPSRARPSRGGD